MTTAANKKVIGCKLLAADGGSITSQYGRVFYKRGEWMEVPGNGAYVAVTGGVERGGFGPVLAWFECESPTAIGDERVQCFRRVKWIDCPSSWGGWLYLGGLTSAEGLTLPQTVGGWLYLGGLTSAEGLTLPRTVGGSLDLGGLTSAWSE